MEGKHSISPGYPCPMATCAYVSKTKDDCQKHCWLKHQKKLSYRGAIPRNPGPRNPGTLEPVGNPSALVMRELSEEEEKLMVKREETLAPNDDVVQSDIKCDICGRAFNFLGSLKAHMKMYHENKFAKPNQVASESALINNVKDLLKREESNPSCAVPMCSVSEMLYPFPIEKEEHSAWLKAIGRNRRYIRPGGLGICGDHFNPDDFTVVEGTDKPTLNPGALPSLFMGRKKPRERCIVDHCDSSDGDDVTVHKWTAKDAVVHEKWLAF